MNKYWVVRVRLYSRISGWSSFRYLTHGNSLTLLPTGAQRFSNRDEAALHKIQAVREQEKKGISFAGIADEEDWEIVDSNQILIESVLQS